MAGDDRGAASLGVKDLEPGDNEVSPNTGIGVTTSLYVVPQNVRNRLVRGLGATALSPILAAATQLGTVPIFLHAWGPAKYGDWLILSAVPAYLALSDLGFGSASGSDMTARVSAGDRKGALCTLHSSWALLNAVSLVVLILVSSTVWWLPWHSWLRLSGIGNHGAAVTIATLTVYTLLSQQISILESGYRCDGNFAAGTFWLTILRFCETLGGCAAGILSGSFMFAALAYLGIRLIGTIGYAVLLRRRCPWILIGMYQARVDRIKELSKAGLGFIALPAGSALSLQGFTLLIGFALGPLAVASFSTMRTLSRLTVQISLVVAHAVWPELSRAFGARDFELAATLFRRAYQLAIVGALGCGAILWTVGPPVYRFWVRQDLLLDSQCFHILILAGMAYAIWYTSFTLPMSNNTHYRLAMGYAAVTAASLGLGLVLTRTVGLSGAAESVLAVEVGMAVAVLRNCSRQLHHKPAKVKSPTVPFRLHSQ